jgi:hypothetical protein
VSLCVFSKPLQRIAHWYRYSTTAKEPLLAGSAFCSENRAGYKTSFFGIGHVAVHLYFGPKSFATKLFYPALPYSINGICCFYNILSNGNFVPV